MYIVALLFVIGRLATSRRYIRQIIYETTRLIVVKKTDFDVGNILY